MARKPKKAALARKPRKAPQGKPTINEIIKGLRKANAELGKDFADLQATYIKLDGEHGKLTAELGLERAETSMLRERIDAFVREVGSLRRREARTGQAVRHLSQFIVDLGRPPEARRSGGDIYEEVARRHFNTQPGSVNQVTDGEAPSSNYRYQRG